MREVTGPMVWDKLLDLDLFPSSIRKTEIAFYLQHLNQYGLPLDNQCRWKAPSPLCPVPGTLYWTTIVTVAVWLRLPEPAVMVPV